MRDALVHGGALDAAIRAYGGARADWLDLSTGIAPRAPSLPAISPDAWTRLPEREAETALRETARRAYDAPEGAMIVPAPGTQSLISLWPHLFGPGGAAVVSPTYAEHAAALDAAGHAVRAIARPDDIDAATRLLVVVNPNNPDGRRFSRPALLDLADELAGREGLLVVDEAFMDPDPAESVSGDAGRPGLLVLRSFGKFYGLAGLRLGFALAEPALGRRLEARLGPWAVSGPAIEIATALMRDEAADGRQRERVAAQGRLLLRTLDAAGLPVLGSTPLFALAHHKRAHALFEALARRRILTRPFATEPGWLRFGVPAHDKAAARLSAALADALSEVRA